LNLAKIMQRRLLITGSTLRPRSIEEKTAIAQQLGREVWPLFKNRQIKVVVDKVMPFAEVRAAHEYFESAQHTGKVILQLSP
jgi:NADPH:quinone reductase-like Zn-dependent oxidoreductase